MIGVLTFRGETVTLRGCVSNVYPTIHNVWVTWYEEVAE